MHILLFEDDLVSRLDPIAVGRPAFDVLCGGYRLLDLVAELGHPIRAVVRPHLADVLAADHPDLVAEPPRSGGGVLMLNARTVPSASVLRGLEQWAASGRSGVVRSGQSVAAALLPPDQPGPQADAARDPAAWIDALGLEPVDVPLPLLEYPHELIARHPAALKENLEHRLARGAYREIAEGVFAASGAALGEHCTADTRQGPVVLEEGASVGPFCYLRGPVHLGARSRVNEHASLKDAVAAGHTTRLGGEIEASIVEPCTNKQHAGFLGHSYLGRWVNLGAGTCTSDLKNTYGPINMDYRGHRVETGMQFLGCIVGDYSKTAVNTSIFTGKTIGVCSMVYGFVTSNVPSFVNYARSFGQVTEAPVEVMIAVQARMFARRGVEQRACDVQLLRDVYELVRHERELPDRPLVL